MGSITGFSIRGISFAKNKLYTLMNRIFTLSLLALLFWGQSLTAQIGPAMSDHFVIKVNTSNTTFFGNCDKCFTIPTTGGGYDYEVDWNNDGVFEAFGPNDIATHEYNEPGVYTIRIKGHFPRIYFNAGTESLKILEVVQWGTNVWQNMESAFLGCSNLTGMDTAPPDLTEVTDMSFMFAFAISFNQNIGNWNTQNVTDMSGLFRSATSFNQDIGSWHTQNVENMNGMFRSAISFDQNIGNWITGEVTNMADMFYNAGSFNQNIGGWITEKVTDMSNMFYAASSFNTEIGNWNTQNVTDMSSMFYEATFFDQDLGNWNVGIADLNLMLDKSGLSTMNYDATLTGWDAAGYTGRNLGAFGLNYCVAEDIRQNLIDNKNWTIDGDVFFCTGTEVPYAPNEFVITVKTDNLALYGSSCASCFTIPTRIGDYYDYDVDWNNDGHFEAIGLTGDATKNYITPGTYTLRIRGDFPQIYFNGQGEHLKIIAVNQWGNNVWKGMERTFLGCANLVLMDDVAPDLSQVTNMSYMFYDAASFNQDIGNWNTQNVTNMSGLFSGAESFNQDIGNWQTQNVLNMRSMFDGASSFDQDIGGWITGEVTTMAYMFDGATSFDQEIGNWNTGKVSNMSGMFTAAESFNQEIGDWNTGEVTNMSAMFGSAGSFNKNISNWNTQKVVNMSSMFSNAANFNQNITNWQTQNVTDMSFMFLNASSFDQNLGPWNVGGADMEYMLTNSGLSTQNYDATLIGWDAAGYTDRFLDFATGLTYCLAEDARQNLLDKGWNIFNDALDCTGIDVPYAPDEFIITVKTDNVSPGNACASCFTIPTEGGGYNYEVDWNNNGVFETTGQTGNATHDYGTAGTYTLRIRGDFPRIYFDGSGERFKLLAVEQWGANVWQSMEGAFSGCTNLTGMDSAAPDLSQVTSMRRMFHRASQFDQDIGNWETGTVTDMREMFAFTDLFNQDIGNWSTHNVLDMSFMFTDAVSFNRDLNGWDTGSVQNMSAMFQVAVNFNGDISTWDTGNVLDMSSMFSDAVSFNQDLNEWNTGNVQDMSAMFQVATNFNGEIGNWNAGNVTDMSNMFAVASSFNKNIGNWNTGKVTNMSGMFAKATSFDADIGGWNTEKVTNMNNMFGEATSFNQDISDWDTGAVTIMSFMFNSALAFDQNIGEWNTEEVIGMNFMFFNASVFNQDISEWNTSKVTNMAGMFSNANAFNQNLRDWDISGIVLSSLAFGSDLKGMFDNSGMDLSNYDQTLLGWAQQDVTSGIELGAVGLEYCLSATAREELIDQKNWTFVGDTYDCSNVIPELICPDNISIPLGGNCMGSLDLEPQSFLQLPAPLGLEVTNTQGIVDGENLFPAGENPLTFTVDNAGNTANCSFTVTVTDNVPPTFLACSGNLILDNDPGVCGAFISGINPTVDDDCPGTVVELVSEANLGNNQVFPVGTTTVTYRATDASGNSAECSFTVTVIDTEEPVFTTCPDNRDVMLSGACMVIVPDLLSEAIATDNCWGALTQFPAAGNAVNAVHDEEVIVTITATDAAGLTATCDVILTAKDTEEPTVLTQNITLTFDNPGSQTITPAMIDFGSFDNCGIVSFTIDQTSFDDTQVGANTVTLTATDAAGNASAATATVTVVVPSEDEYCQAGGFSTDYEWIEAVAVNGTENASGNNGGYADFTQQTAFELSAGTSNAIVLTPGFAGSPYYEYWTVFIDLNQDSEFTNDELVFYKKRYQTVHGSFFLPANTMPGSTRMRVVMSYHCYQDACDVFDHGEVEDYTVNITQFVPNYCEVSGQSTQYEWIGRVRFADLDHTSGNDGGYGDHTDQTATVHQGSYYLFKGNPGYSDDPEWEYWSAWADWNQDGDFNDYGELLFDRRRKGQLNKWFYVPSWAPSGVTRMRVAMSYYGWAYPCTDFSYGEVEDYTLLVGATAGATGNEIAVSDGPAQENFTLLEAQRSGLRADLSWSTTEGLNTDYFVVERSADGVSFDSIGVETQVHDTYEPMAYAFTDDTPLKGDNYYRLRLMTPRGEATYSEVRQLHFEQSGGWTVFPNPANSYTHVDLQSYAGQSATIRLIDAQGTVRLRQTFDALPEEPVRLNLSKLMDGTYRVWVKVEGQRAQTRMIVVTRLWGETIQE